MKKANTQGSCPDGFQNYRINSSPSRITLNNKHCRSYVNLYYWGSYCLQLERRRERSSLWLDKPRRPKKSTHTRKHKTNPFSKSTCPRLRFHGVEVGPCATSRQKTCIPQSKCALALGHQGSGFRGFFFCFFLELLRCHGWGFHVGFLYDFPRGFGHLG